MDKYRYCLHARLFHHHWHFVLRKEDVAQNVKTARNSDINEQRAMHMSLAQSHNTPVLSIFSPQPKCDPVCVRVGVPGSSGTTCALAIKRTEGLRDPGKHQNQTKKKCPLQSYVPASACCRHTEPRSAQPPSTELLRVMSLRVEELLVLLDDDIYSFWWRMQQNNFSPLEIKSFT